MTRIRYYGSDTPFCAWMRNCKELPSKSDTCGFVATDNDLTIHRYLVDVDGIGSREVRPLMQVEIKTRNGEPTYSQEETYRLLNEFRGSRLIGNVYVRYFGISVLSMSGTTPDNSEFMRWGRFSKKGQIIYREISRKQLINLFRFDIHPDNLRRRPFRRHHKTSEIITRIQTELGFEIDAIVVNRS